MTIIKILEKELLFFANIYIYFHYLLKVQVEFWHGIRNLFFIIKAKLFLWIPNVQN